MSRTSPARILVIGGGGREHALAWKLAGEPGVALVTVAPGSAGIAREAGVRTAPVDAADSGAVVDVARSTGADLVVVGPEAPLATGVADALLAAGIPVFGPDRAAAMLETSKAFCHEVAAAAGVRMARGRSFRGDEVAAADAYVRELAADGAGIVLKADGLAAGKGVIVTESVDQALELLPSFLAGRPAGVPALVVEERLSGAEASVIAVCDGERVVALPSARDHKRLCDGDAGPNTGGMGAYSPLPDLDDATADTVIDSVHRPVLAEMARRGSPFRGFLYAGLMLTTDGPALLEFNVRMGDPEAQVVLPRLAAPLAPVLLAAATGRLPDGLARLPAVSDAAVGVVLAAEGYPGRPAAGRSDRWPRRRAGRGRARVPCGHHGPAGRGVRDERRPGADGGRPRSRSGHRPGPRPSEPPMRSAGTACSAATTSPRRLPASSLRRSASLPRAAQGAGS